METLQGSAAGPGSTEWKRGRSRAGKEEKRVGSSRLLSASSQPVQQHRQQLQAAGFSSHLRGRSPQNAVPLHHDPLAVALLGLLHVGGAA